MKKVMLVLSISLLLIVIFSSLTLATNKIMLSYDMEGKIKSWDSDWWDDDDAKISDVDSGFAVGYECTYKSRRVDFGFGFETQLKRSLPDYKDSEFKFTPMYGVIYVNFVNDEESSPFFVGRLGFNTHTGNDAYKAAYGTDMELGNGLYGAIGFGFNSKRSIAAMLYSINCGSVTSNSDSDQNRDIAYSKFSFVYGFKF